MNAERWLRACGFWALWAGSISIVFAEEVRAMPYCSSREFVREINDAASGSRWLLFRDLGHPGGPGNLVLLTGSGDADQARGCRSGEVQRPTQDVAKTRKIVIRPGDRLAVREQTWSMDLVLDGTALGPAAEGEPLNVRLRIGRTVRAIAVLRGLAKLAPQQEAQPWE